MARKYFLDGEEIDWRALIEVAANTASGFDDPSFKTTSEAARILRARGHEVTMKEILDAV